MGALDSISTFAAMIPLPAVVLWRILTTTHAPYNKHRSMKRIMVDSIARYMLKTFHITKIQAQVGSTLDVYSKWAKQVKLPVVVEELGEDARLLWLGPKRLDHVVLFVHGGGYALPPPNSALMFWQHVRQEMEKKGVEPGIVMLSYSLWPKAAFPKPLAQMRRAVEFLFAAGVQPNCLQLAGDSAGGNLIIQLFSHILHPHPAVPELKLTAPICAAHLFSPWVGLLGETPSYDENDGIDYMPRDGLVWIGSRIVEGFTEKYRTFAEASRASPAWFTGVEQLVGSVLITIGEAECMRDDILQFGKILKKHHPRVEVVVQPGGFHEDMFLDFELEGTKLGMLTPLIVERLIAGFAL